MSDEIILMQSTVGYPSGRPSVQLKWGEMSGQLTPEEARHHARLVMECAEAAISDAALVEWLTVHLGLDQEKAFR